MLSGCSFKSVAPEQAVYISNTTRLSELEGTFINKGDPEGYISDILWGSVLNKLHKITHNEIKYINVTENKGSLTVKAINNNCSIFSKVYKYGTDFEIKEGKIYLTHEAHLLSRGSGDVMLGPSYEERSIGIDIQGNGAYTEQSHAAGLVFLLVPIAISHQKEIRFNRINKDKSFSEC